MSNFTMIKTKYKFYDLNNITIIEAVVSCHGNCCKCHGNCYKCHGNCYKCHGSHCQYHGNCCKCQGSHYQCELYYIIICNLLLHGNST